MNRWILIYVGCNVGLVGAALLMFWVSNGFEALGISSTGAIMFTLAAIVTSGLAVALMAAIFWSNRGGADIGAYEVTYHHDDEEAVSIPVDHPEGSRK